MVCLASSLETTAGIPEGLRCVKVDDLMPVGFPLKELAQGPPVNPLHASLMKQVREEEARVAITCLFDKLTARGEPIAMDVLRRMHVAELAIAQHLLGLFRPRAVLVWNGQNRFACAMAQRARAEGVPVLFVERGPFAGTLQVDGEGVNGRSSLAARTASDYQRGLSPAESRELEEFLGELTASGASAWDQPSRRDTTRLWRDLGISAEAKVVFFPGQVDLDTNVILKSNSPHFADSNDALQWLCGHAAERPDWHVVAKKHPKARKDLVVPGDSGSRAHVVTDVNIHDLLDLCDAVVSINSSVVLEAMAAGKPVLALGKGLFSNKEAVLEAGSREDAAAKLKQLLGNPPVGEDCRRRRKRLLHALIFRDLYRTGEHERDGEMERLAQRIMTCADRHTPTIKTSAPADALEILVRHAQWRQPRDEFIRHFSGRQLLHALARTIIEGLGLSRERNRDDT